jgi:uncharacterized membrane protein (DUF373 family)
MQMDWREGGGQVFMVMVNGATLTFLLIMLKHSFGTLIYSFHSGGDKTQGGVLNILIVLSLVTVAVQYKQEQTFSYMFASRSLSSPSP